MFFKFYFNRKLGAKILLYLLCCDGVFAAPVFFVSLSQDIGKRNRRSEVIAKLRCVIDYNKAKKGVDYSDQMSSYHSVLPLIERINKDTQPYRRKHDTKSARELDSITVVSSESAVKSQARPQNPPSQAKSRAFMSK